MGINVVFNGEPTQQRAFAVKLDEQTVGTVPLVYLQAKGHNVSERNADDFAAEVLLPLYEKAYEGTTFAGLKAEADNAFDNNAARERYTPERLAYHQYQSLRSELEARNNVDLRPKAEVLALRA